MLLLEGRKAWTLFPRDSAHELRPSYAHGSHDASFGEDVTPEADAADGSGAADGNSDSGGDAKAEAAALDAQETPVWRTLERWSTVLEPGEILFVPCGCPHAVANLTVTAALSANFVSPSNRSLAVAELSVAGLQRREAAQLAAHLKALPPECEEPWGHPASGGQACAPGPGAELSANLPWASFKRNAHVQQQGEGSVAA